MAGGSRIREGPIGESDKFDESLNRQTTSLHVAALDGLVNVNSFFTVAVFVGLSFATPGQKSLDERGTCDASDDIARNLLIFEVVSFSSFLFSSLIAQGLKLEIVINNSKLVGDANKSKQVDEAARLRLGMLVCAVGSVIGCIFLMLSMVNVIQIRLGVLSCKGSSTLGATLSLVALVSTALIIYISRVMYAFTH